jgi:hypothetical protein
MLFQNKRRESMKSRHAALRVAAVAALIITVVGVLWQPTSAHYATGNVPAPAPRLEIAGSNPALPFEDPEAIYEAARIVHNVTVDGVKGMRVHAKFRVRYGLGVPCMMIAYFYYDDQANTPLKSGDADYRDKKGNVAATTNFTPAYDPAVYNDLQLFMPYDALNMESGETYQLKFYLALYDKEGGRFFGKSGWYKFNLTMP